MNVQNLIEMANQIGQFFSVYPDQVDAKKQIANHVQKYWEPRMRLALLEHVAAHSGAGLDPLVLGAVEDHRADLVPLG